MWRACVLWAWNPYVLAGAVLFSVVSVCSDYLTPAYRVLKTVPCSWYLPSLMLRPPSGMQL